MVHNCAILTCPLHNRRNIRKGFLFHSFPVDQHRFELWRLAVIKYCSRTLSINKHSKICHRHFRPDDYIANHTGLTRYLKATAIPSIFNDTSTTSIRPYLSPLTIDSQHDRVMNASKAPLTSSASVILTSPSVSSVVLSTTSDPKAKRLLTTIDKLHQIQNASKSSATSAVVVDQDSTKLLAEESMKSNANEQYTMNTHSAPLPPLTPQITNLLPRNELEETLYKFLQQANLLQYYSAFLDQGGDDLKQLAEAESEDFQEIITLVGMASKPLHVKRFKKALDDYRKVMNHKHHHERSSSPDHSSFVAPTLANSPTSFEHPRLSASWRFQASDPSINDHQRKLIADEAERLANLLPLSSIRKVSGPNPLSENMNLPRDFEDRWQRIRKIATIYNNPFDSKRQDRTLTLHEILMNEAAASICFHRPEFLTRRNELVQVACRVLQNVGLSDLSATQKRWSNVMTSSDNSSSKHLKLNQSTVKSSMRQRDSDAFRLMWRNREAKLAQIPIETEALRCEQMKLLQRLKQNTIDPLLSIDNTALKKQIDDLGKRIEQLIDEEKTLRRLIRKRHIRLRAKERQSTIHQNSTLDNFIMPTLSIASLPFDAPFNEDQQRISSTSTSSFMHSTENNEDILPCMNIKNEKIEPIPMLLYPTELNVSEEISVTPSSLLKSVDQAYQENNERTASLTSSASLLTQPQSTADTDRLDNKKFFYLMNTNE